jgi:hypothetical protein
MAKAIRKKRVFFGARTTSNSGYCICEILERNEHAASKGGWIPWTPLTRPLWRRGKALMKQLMPPPWTPGATTCPVAIYATAELADAVEQWVNDVEREHGKKIWQLCTWTGLT